MAALTSNQIAALSGCFDCLSPGIKETYMVTLLQQIQGSLPGASLTTTSPGGLLTVTDTSAANLARKKFTLQNQKNEELYVKFGTGASATDYHILLPPHNTGSKNSDPLMLDGYTGAISVAPTSGSPSYTFAEFV
ncbi:MAG: hypothetical protein RJB26_919 [Pseudomonadota bacterium]|jgi:hypothetical protein